MLRYRLSVEVPARTLAKQSGDGHPDNAVIAKASETTTALVTVKNVKGQQNANAKVKGTGALRVTENTES